MQDPPNKRELLTFSAHVSGLTQPSSITEEEDEEDLPSAGSEYEPSDGERADTDDGDDDMAESQGFSIPASSQDGPTYDAETAQMWTVSVVEFEEQFNIRAPDLRPRTKLERFAAQQPEAMTALCRHCVNPFAILDHLSDKGIKAWMEAKRLRQCVNLLGCVVPTIKDDGCRTVLMDWVLGLESEQDLATKRALYRHADRWQLLQQVLPHVFTGPAPVAFLERNYSKVSAFVMVVEEIFPSLAKTIMTKNFGTKDQEWPETIALSDLYLRCSDFKQVMTKAIAEESWDVVVDYMNGLTVLTDGPTISRH